MAPIAKVLQEGVMHRSTWEKRWTELDKWQHKI